jgi:hypothetical protein
MVKLPVPWWSEPEGMTLERKSVGALGDLRGVGRAVVSMLNTSGGLVAIGVREDGAIDDVPDAARQRDRVQQFLHDSIEPKPRDLQVEIEEVKGRKLLKVVVPAPGEQSVLYAERSKGRYGFWTRFGSITAPLQYYEIVRRLGDRSVPEPPPPLMADLENDPRVRLILRMIWKPQLGLSAPAVRACLEGEARARIEGREMGWIAIPPGPVPRPREGRVELGERAGRHWLRLDVQTGEARFEGSREFLEWMRPSWLPADGPFLYPYPIVEGTLSFVRLARELGLAAEARSNVRLTLELALIHAEGACLGPGRPGSVAWELGGSRWQPPLTGGLVHLQHEASFGDVERRPDLHAYTLVERLYEWFGYAASAVPFWREEETRFDIT